MGCRLSYTINATANAFDNIFLQSEYSASLKGTPDILFFVEENVYLDAKINSSNVGSTIYRDRQVLLGAEYSSSFEVCGRNITSANPTEIRVDNTNIPIDNNNLFIDTNNPS